MPIKIFSPRDALGHPLKIPKTNPALDPSRRMDQYGTPENVSQEFSPGEIISITDQFVETQTLSKESPSAPFETLFHNFEIEADPVYNFWTEDETENDRDDRGERKLEDIPRFMRVTWLKAPDLQSIALDNKLKRDISPVKFSAETEKDTSYLSKGVNFTPGHLQPKNFSTIKNFISNYFLNPGVVNSVVEIAPKAKNSEKRVNETAFLASPNMRGIPIHELQSNLHQQKNSSIGVSSVIDPEFRGDSDFSLDENFIGQMQITKAQDMSVSMNSGLLPSLSLHVKLAGVEADIIRDPTNGEIDSIVFTDEQPQSQAVKATFVNTRLGGAISDERIDSISEPHHAETMTALAQTLPNLEVLSHFGLDTKNRKVDIPSFPSPVGLRALQYVGYVLEKYSLGPSGEFALVEEIDLPSIDYTQYIDTKVKYGGVYRYRIRSIFRWTYPPEMGPNGLDRLTIPVTGSQTQDLAPYKSSYFTSEWSLNWAYGHVLDIVPPPPPDEFTIRPLSRKKQIIITAKFPENKQRDIFLIRVFRKLRDSNGNDVTGWTQIGPNYGPQNIIFIDEDVDYYESNGLTYIYTSQCVSRHAETSPFSEQLACRLNKEFKVFGEYPITFVSCRGVLPNYFGAFSTFPPRRIFSETVIPIPLRTPEEKDPSARVVMSARETIGDKLLNPRYFILRFDSLDTGEEKDVYLNLTYNNLDPLVNEMKIPVIMNTPATLARALRGKGPFGALSSTK